MASSDGTISRESLVELGQEIIRIPSFKGEETELANWLGNYFDERGYQVDLQEVEPGRFQTIAVLPGTSDGAALMFNGHLDIDPLRSGWKRDPFNPVAEGDALYGAGARNMKGGLTSMIAAAESIRQGRGALAGDLIVACVAGELQGGVGTTYALRNGLTAKAAIVPEPFAANNLVTGTCGVLELAITTSGFSEHISRAEGAIDPLPMMMAIIEALRGIQFTYEKDEAFPALPRLVVGGIIGGRGDDYDMRGPNYTPDRCTIVLDVRYNASQTSDSVIEDIRRTIEAVRSRFDVFNYEISFESRPPYVLNQVIFEPAVVPIDEPIVSLVSSVYEQFTGRQIEGKGVVLPHSYCGADTAHLWAAGIPSVLHGPTGPARTPEDSDDCVFISEMLTVSNVMAGTALRFDDYMNGRA